MVAIRPYTTTSPSRSIAFWVGCRWSVRSRRTPSGSARWRGRSSCLRIHLPHADRLARPGRDPGDGRECLEEAGTVVGEGAARLRLLVPEDDHHRIAALAVDQVECPGVAGLGLERRDQLVGDDAVHLAPALGRGPALDDLCVHGSSTSVVRVFEDVVEVEVVGLEDRLAVVVEPLPARPVVVELDAVAVGVVQVHRHRAAVVGGMVGREAVVDEAADRLCQLAPVRVDERDVVEPGVVGVGGRRPGALERVQADVVVVVACRQKDGRQAPRPAVGDDLEAEGVAVERQRAVDVHHAEVDMADADGGVDGFVAHGGQFPPARPGFHQGVHLSVGENRGVDGLIGREREIAALEEALARVPGAVAIEGEPGIGKSRLLAEVARCAESAGARASEAETDLPYAVFAEALAPKLRDRRIERLGLEDPHALEVGLDPLAGHEAPDRHRVHRALRDLLAALARTGALVFWLDDVQWTDPASADALAALVRRPPEARVLVAFAVREGQAPRPVAAAVAAAMRDGTLARIAPRPLDEEQAAKLVGAAAEAVYADSGGNPFYLEQLARGHGSAGGGFHLEGVPDRVVAALASELDALSSPARVLVDAAAVAGDPFDLPLAARVAELDDPTAALDELVERTLVRPDGPGRFAFRHPVVRRAVYEGTRPGWRVAAHDRAAAALRERGATAVPLAHHVEHAAAPGDEAAIALLETAASELRVTAPASSARLRAAALRLLPAGARDRRAAVTVALADAQNAAGDPEGARGTLLALMDDAEGEERTGLSVRVANVEYWLGRHDDARRRLQVALQSLPAEPSADRVRLHLGVGLSMLMTQELEESAAHATDARDDARALGDPVLEAAALAVAAVAATSRHPADPAAADTGGAAFAALSDAGALVRLPGLWMLARANRALGRFELALGQLQRGTRLARSSGRPAVLLLLRAETACVLVELGRLHEAVEAAEEAADRARLMGGPGLLLMALSVLSCARLQRGDVTGALAAADEAAALGQPADFQAPGQPGWARGNALAASA